MTITLTTEDLGLVLDKLVKNDSPSCAEASCPRGSDFDIDSKGSATPSSRFFPNDNEFFPTEEEAIDFLDRAMGKRIILDKTKKKPCRTREKAAVSISLLELADRIDDFIAAHGDALLYVFDSTAMDYMPVSDASVEIIETPKTPERICVTLALNMSSRKRLERE